MKRPPFPIPTFSAIMLLLGAVALQGREWTNDHGLKIVADYVSSDDTSVTLSKAGAQAPIVYPLAKLSTEDQAFVKEEGRKADALLRKGLIPDFPIQAWHPELKEYIKGRTAKKIYDALAAGKPGIWKENKGTGPEQFTYDTEKAQAIVYVPKSYNGQKPYGAYIHLSPGDGADKGEAYQATMDKFNLIYISHQ